MFKASFQHQLQNYTWTILSAVWVIATLVNIDKAFHMDDTFHLEAAQWIQHNPFRPMSGSVNWLDTGQPIYHGNQPPLYFYLIAAVGGLFSYSELPLHLFQSIFTALCIIYFYKLVRIFNPIFALPATTLLVLGPAFLVNQNLMTDIPILTVSIIFFYLLVNPDEGKQTRSIYSAAVILSTGILIKYTLLPLLVVLAYRVLQSRRASLVPAIFIPIITLAVWTAFNYIEYGGSQLHSRPRNVVDVKLLLNNSVSFLLTLGAIAPFSLILIDSFTNYSRRYIVVTIITGLALCMMITYVFVFGFPIESPFYSLLWAAFFINGMVLVIFSLSILRRIELTPGIKLIILWALGLISFIVLFAPFMATRHTLLVLPPLLIIISYACEYTSTKTIALSISLTVLLGVLLSISDWQYANFYRESAPVVLKQIPSSAKVWTVGHWGWQWYSKKAGMEFYDSEKSKPEEGDYFVVPKRVYQQQIKADMKFSKVYEVVYPQNMWNSLTTAHYARFYHTYPQFIPWFVSLTPVDSIIIYKIIE